MIYALTRWDKDEASVCDLCVFYLIQDYPKSQRQSEARDIAKKYEFNAAQVKAVAAFLRFIVDFDEMFATPVNQESLAKWEAL
jgi:hypothetical protein